MKNEIKTDGIGRLAKFMADKFTESSPAPAVGHTPLPWLLTDGLVYRDATGRHATQQLCHEYGRAALMLTHDGSEEGYANAELAKLACNSHAALLAERDGLKDLLLHTQRAAIEVAEERDRLRAALEATAELVKLARQYFPKSIQKSDKFQLENTNAAICAALAEGGKSMNLRELFHLPSGSDKITLINPPRIQGMMTGALMACIEPSGRVTVLYEDHSTESALVPAPIPQDFIPLVSIVQSIARKPKLKTAAALRCQDLDLYMNQEPTP